MLSCVSYGFMSVIGRRMEMEDEVRAELGFVVKEDEKYDFFAVYDGHGGVRVAKACRERLHKLLQEELNDYSGSAKINWEIVMERCFGKMDEEVITAELAKKPVEPPPNRLRMVRTFSSMGSTALVAVVGKEVVVVSNCGDCRAVISRAGVAVALSNDHKPDRPDELERVEAAGGRVIEWDGNRVLGVLATSRSIGDPYLKPFVTATPEVRVIKRTEKDEFLILASDGLWDVISNETACKVTRRCLKGQLRRRSQVDQNKATEAAAVLAELATARGSTDNISVIVIELSKPNKQMK